MEVANRTIAECMSSGAPQVKDSNSPTDMATTSSRTSGQSKEQRSSVKSYRDMGYREKPATPNSPSGTTVTTMYDHLLSPPSPAEEEEKNDRVRNDLLDEICYDMGIDDSMDLDFDDFCYNNGHQNAGSAGSSQRFGQSSAAAKVAEAEGRRASAPAASSSGYATSDSLCAIARLTRSITNEQSAGSEPTELKQRSSPDCGSVKLEPIECEGEQQIGNVNDTDQGKAAQAAASKLALLKQFGEGGSSSTDTKRKRIRENIPQEQGIERQWSSGSNELPLNYSNSQPAGNTSQRTYVDFSYQDDYAMEDMSGPDTMINFSELPQQPNYYQCPQTANDNLNLGFNMSIQQQSPQQGFASMPPSSAIPAAHQQQLPFGRMPFGRMPPQQPPDGTRPLASAQLRNPFQGPAGQHGSTFQSYQGPETSSGPAGSLPTQSGFHRSESFPGAPGAPSTYPTEGQFPMALQHSIPQTTAHKSASSAQPVSSVAGSSLQSNVSISASTSAGASTSATYNSNAPEFMQQLVSYESLAFRSHPLFPLLRDLIIADMNFHDPQFPHRLILNLPSDCNKLLKNYLSRNPAKKDYKHDPSVDSVVMDALKYTHHTLIGKIQQKIEIDKQEQLQPGSTHPAQSPPRTGSGSGLPQPPSREPMSAASEFCEKFEEGSIKHEMAQAQSSYGRGAPMNSTAQPSSSFKPSRRDSGSVYGSGSEMGGPTGGTFNQPLTVDTGCPSPNSSRHSTPSSSSAMYSTGPNPPPPHYPQHQMPVGYSRSPQQPNPRNPYMSGGHGGPPCPPPNYTVTPNNPPLSRHQQTMYEMGPPPPSGPTGMYSDPNSPYHVPYNSYMPVPPTAHHHRLQHMGPAERHLMYMNNINNGNMVKTMMEGGKEMYENMSDNGSALSGHSLQGSVKGQPQNQGKPAEGRKHASLPKEAVNIMLSWLREHQDKPYPNDDEKGMLIKQTGLSITQINYWFTNARRRLLPKWRGEDL